jgi:hypothetical protein
MRPAYRIVTALLVLLGVACARTPEELCEDFADECDETADVDACVDRAERLQFLSEREGCMDEFYAYLDCVDELSSLCETAEDCHVPRLDLERCGVVFE